MACNTMFVIRVPLTLGFPLQFNSAISVRLDCTRSVGASGNDGVLLSITVQF